MSVHSEIRLLAAELEDGENRRVVCPACQGGSSGERSLSISREGGSTVWHCFRASCTQAGGTSQGRKVVRTTPKQAAPKRLPNKVLPPNEEWREFLRETVGFDNDHLVAGRVYVTDDGHVAYPIIGPMGERRGYVKRRYDGGSPKALTYLEERPGLSWYRNASPLPAVLVEDIPSAIRAARYRTAVALLGTNTTREGIAEIAAHCRSVVWALDADATVQAIRNCTRNAIWFDESSVMTLTKDLKDMTEEELNDRLRSNT